MKKAKHLAEEYGEKAVNKVKSVRDEGKKKKRDRSERMLCRGSCIYLFILNHTAYIHVPVANLLNITRKCPVQLEP